MTTTYTRKKIQNYSYGLNDIIGKGYSSKVYKGRNDHDDNHVAIKVIDMNLLKNDINKMLLQSQIVILKELKEQEHILHLYDVYTTKNNTYIITELCQADLSSRVKNGLTQDQAIKYMKQIINGYLYFANRHIIHRDLKPANILITKNQELKIADFGFAIKTCDAHKYNKYNVGSPLYMAPESLKKNQYTLKTDIWALGIILFQLLTGQTPWKAKNQKQLLKKIESQKIDDLLYKIKSTNPMIKQFLKRTLELDKTARLQLTQLLDFSFDSKSVISIPRNNILTQKKMNSSMKSVSIDIRNTSIFSPKTSINITNLNDRSKINSKDLSQRKNISMRNESINKSVQLKSFKPNDRRTQNTYKQNPQINEPKTDQITKSDKKDKKFTSKLLISQIHFCRFLYKLLSKISQSSKKGLLQYSLPQVDNIMKDYLGIIKHKLQNLLTFKSINYIQIQNYQQYKQTNDYFKLMKIGKEYKDRYSNEMKQYWNICCCRFDNQSTINLIGVIYKMLLEVKDGFNQYQKDIIILDYLMTSKQLIDIFKNGENYQRFAKKSRIQQIVEGKTSQITYQLYMKIVTRASEMLSMNKTVNRQPQMRRERQRLLLV